MTILNPSLLKQFTVFAYTTCISAAAHCTEEAQKNGELALDKNLDVLKEGSRCLVPNPHCSA